MLTGIKNTTINLFSENAKASNPLIGMVLYPKQITIAMEENSGSTNMIHALHRRKNRIQARRNMNLG